LKGDIVKKRILVVDDEPRVTRLLKRGLESLGYYEVHEVNEPQRAVKAAHLFSPDLILLDLMMPEMDGGELLSDFVASPVLKHIPVIFVTSLVTKTEVCDGTFESGHRTYLPKPVDFPALVHCMDRHFSEAHKVENVVPIEVATLSAVVGDI
jgi:CheY-like chemotaxis protein